GINMKNKAKYIIQLIAIIITLSIIGCGDEAAKQQEITIPVKIYNVQSESLTQYLKLTGTITAGKDQVVYSKTSERVDAVYVKPGDRVNANQVIARQYNALLTQ